MRTVQHVLAPLIYKHMPLSHTHVKVTREEQIIGQLIPTAQACMPPSCIPPILHMQCFRNSAGAQVREPFSAVRCLAEYSHPSLPEQLKIKPLKELNKEVHA